ncbi:MAG: hypothetical protein ACFFFH_03845 [Candidatus Thorarchaeota archaeon]
MKTILEKIKYNFILTIAVRGVALLEKSFDLLKKYLELTTVYQNFTFCIVAGHPAYKDSFDTCIPLIQAFESVFRQIREKTNIPVFLGAENLSSSTINLLCEKYPPVIPFLLYGDKRVFQKNGINSKFAIYSPIVKATSQKEAIQSTLSYLLRRKATQELLKSENLSFSEIPLESWDKITLPTKRILEQSFDQYILSSSNLKKKIKTFTKQGVRMIVGHPIAARNTNHLIEEFKFNTEFNE